jgi:hypothetical protein
MSVSSGSNVLQNSAITIRQRDRLDIAVAAAQASTCQVATTTGGQNKTISFGVEGEEFGRAVSLPKFHFEQASQLVTVSCSDGTASSSESFTVNVTELGVQSGPAPAFTSTFFQSLSGTPLNGGSFTLDTPVKVGWQTTNATSCHFQGRPEEYAPNNVGTELPPYYFGQPGAYSFGFYCVGEGGATDVIAVNFTVTPPTSPVTVDPGFRGDYVVDVISVNSDAKPDIYVRPAPGNTSSGVAEFVLVSQPNNTGYTISRVQSGWNTGAILQAGLDLVLGDYDADGYDDMIIKNINGVDDVITYAPRTSNSIPGGFGENGYVVVDQNFKTFFEDLYNTMGDASYLNSHTYVDIQPVVYYMDFGTWGLCSSDVNAGALGLSVCNDPFGWYSPIPVFDDIVTLYKIVELSTGMPDYRFWLPEINNLRCVLWCNGQTGVLDTGTILSGSNNAIQLSESLSSILNRPFMRNVLLNDPIYDVRLDFEIGIPLPQLGLFRLIRFQRSVYAVAEEVIDTIPYDQTAIVGPAYDPNWVAGNPSPSYGKTFEERSFIYETQQGVLNALGKDTVWFGVAAELNDYFGHPINDLLMPEYVNDLGIALLDHNTELFEQIRDGEITLTGAALDEFLVDKEQEFVHQFLLREFPNGVPFLTKKYMDAVVFGEGGEGIQQVIYPAINAGMDQVEQEFQEDFSFYNINHRKVLGKKMMEIKRQGN